MLFNCEFCGEDGMELSEGVMSVPFFVDTEMSMKSEPCIVMKCIQCGVEEPCETEDIIHFIMQLVDEKQFGTAMIKALKIIWKDRFLEDLKE
tara:strand:- start:2700 stop:2975 length:276 start_codon:yes stop_codon:yes gene_type:complete